MLFRYEIINFEFSIIVFFVRNVGNVVLRKGLYGVKFLNFFSIFSRQAIAYRKFTNITLLLHSVKEGNQFITSR